MAVKLSQNERVLAYLAKGNKLTSRVANSRLNITRLSARIFDLREAGWVIYSNPVKGQGTVQYRLDTNDQEFYNTL